MLRKLVLAMALSASASVVNATSIDIGGTTGTAGLNTTGEYDNYGSAGAITANQGTDTSNLTPVDYSFTLSSPASVDILINETDNSPSNINGGNGYGITVAETDKLNAFTISQNGLGGEILSGTLSTGVLYSFSVAGNTVNTSSFTIEGFTNPSTVPLPGGLWLLSTAMAGLVAYGKRKRAQA